MSGPTPATPAGDADDSRYDDVRRAVEPARPDRVQVSRGGPWTINTWLVVLNVAVFVLDHYAFPSRLATDGYRQFRLPSPVDGWLSFSFGEAVARLEVWRFVTFQFVHANLLHIGGNMLGLIALGRSSRSSSGVGDTSRSTCCAGPPARWRSWSWARWAARPSRRGRR